MSTELANYAAAKERAALAMGLAWVLSRLQEVEALLRATDQEPEAALPCGALMRERELLSVQRVCLASALRENLAGAARNETNVNERTAA